MKGSPPYKKRNPLDNLVSNKNLWQDLIYITKYYKKALQNYLKKLVSKILIANKN